MALKEIRLEHEEGAPCTAIREGESIPLYLSSSLTLSPLLFRTLILLLLISMLHSIFYSLSLLALSHSLLFLLFVTILPLLVLSLIPLFPSLSPVSLLKDLKHANIVTLHDIVHTDKSLTLVFEYLVRITYYLTLLTLHAGHCSQKSALII